MTAVYTSIILTDIVKGDKFGHVSINSFLLLLLENQRKSWDACFFSEMNEP